MSTFLDQIFQNAGDRRGLTVVGEDTVSFSWREIGDQAARMAGSLAELGIGPGATVAVLAGGPGDVAPLTQALWMRGAALTMLHQPTARANLRAWLADASAAVTMLAAAVVVVGAPFDLAVDPLRKAGHRVVTVAELRGGVPIAPVDVRDDDVAMRQLTSGSTGAPKAVEITYSNLAANTVAMVDGVEADPDIEVMVTWLPLSHDMGMVGFLAAPMQLGIELVATTPDRFLRRPSLWPELITDFGGTITAGPNFAYNLLARTLSNAFDGVYDLSTLRVALNGAEPIDPQVVDRLATAGRRFGLSASAITPAYGMAETTLAISFDSVRRAPHLDVVDRDRLQSEAVSASGGDRTTRAVVSVGRPVAGIEVRIIDSVGRELSGRQVGGIQVRGPMVSRGYTTTDGWLSAQDENGWLDTGDLGYLDENGELYVCGRVKDTIILGGKNIYPTDIERAAADVPGVRQGNAVAIRIDPGQAREGFAVIAESTDAMESAVAQRIQSQIARAVHSAVGYSPRQVLVVAPGRLPKTPSGKLRRTAAIELLTTCPPAVPVRSE